MGNMILSKTFGYDNGNAKRVNQFAKTEPSKESANRRGSSSKKANSVDKMVKSLNVRISSNNPINCSAEDQNLNPS